MFEHFVVVKVHAVFLARSTTNRKSSWTKGKVEKPSMLHDKFTYKEKNCHSLAIFSLHTHGPELNHPSQKWPHNFTFVTYKGRAIQQIRSEFGLCIFATSNEAHIDTPWSKEELPGEGVIYRGYYLPWSFVLQDVQLDARSWTTFYRFRTFERFELWASFFQYFSNFTSACLVDLPMLDFLGDILNNSQNLLSVSILIYLFVFIKQQKIKLEQKWY